MDRAMIDGELKPPTKGAHGVCPDCHGKVVAHVGTDTSYFSHLPRFPWDKWWEPETRWHIEWKEHFSIGQRENSILKSSKEHIADVQTLQPIVIEFQHSRLSGDNIKERENFYGDMVWVVDASVGKNMEMFEHHLSRCQSHLTPTITKPDILPPSLININEIWRFYWPGNSRFFRSWAAPNAAKPVFLDFDSMGFWWLLSYDHDNANPRCGYVMRIAPEAFLNWLGGNFNAASGRASEISFTRVDDPNRITWIPSPRNIPTSVKAPRSRKCVRRRNSIH